MPHRPRVLHVYKDYFPPVMGGVELTINMLAEGCSNRFESSVLVNSTNRTSSEEIIDGVRVVKVSEWGRAASAPISPAFVTALRREAAKADILHFHHPNPTGDLARLLARPSAPVVMTYHSDVVRQKWAMAIYGPLQDWMMRNTEVIMPTSPDYMESSPWLRRHLPRCKVVPLGIRVEELDASAETDELAAVIRKRYPGPLVLFVGRLRYYKGLHFLVEAMATVPGTLLIAGTGSIQQDLMSLASSLGVSERIHFLGDISEEEKRVYYYAADVFCMPSHLRSEAFGLSQVEAMATGLPVVSTRIASGVPFVNQDGVSGLTVEPANPVALAEAINAILEDNSLRERLAAGARNRARTMFTAQRMCQDVMAVYDSVLKNQHR